MIEPARRIGIVSALAGLGGLVDGVVRGMVAAEALAAAGWCALAAGGATLVGTGIVVALARAWRSDDPALAITRARLTAFALAAWATVLVVLADRFALKFSALDLAALLWAALGIALGIALAIVVEPLARGLAPRFGTASSRGRVPAYVPVVLAIATLGACAAALVRGTPGDPRSLGAIAARGLGA